MGVSEQMQVVECARLGHLFLIIARVEHREEVEKWNWSAQLLRALVQDD